MIRLMPMFLLRPLLWLIGFLTGALGLNLKKMGLERFPFGSCIVTSVGMFGLDEGFAPPTPFARVPVYVLVGAIRERPVVIDGELTVCPQLTITATIDHRFIDGYQGGVLAKVVRKVVEHPFETLGEVEALASDDIPDDPGGEDEAAPEAAAPAGP